MIPDLTADMFSDEEFNELQRHFLYTDYIKYYEDQLGHGFVDHSVADMIIKSVVEHGKSNLGRYIFPHVIDFFPELKFLFCLNE